MNSHLLLNFCRFRRADHKGVGSAAALIERVLAELYLSLQPGSPTLGQAEGKAKKNVEVRF